MLLGFAGLGFRPGTTAIWRVALVLAQLKSPTAVIWRSTVGPNRRRNLPHSGECGLTLACPHPKIRFTAALFGRAAHDRHCVGVLAHSAGHSVHA